MKKRIIWSNMDVNPEDWKESYKETAELNELDEDTEDENNLWNYIGESLASWLDDEKANLNFPLEERIIAIADLGLWNGRKIGYRILKGNVHSIFDVNEDYSEYYSDGYNIKATCSHHDGINYVEFRVIRKDRDIYNLLNDIYNGKEISRKKLNYYTRSLHKYVANIYGW